MELDDDYSLTSISNGAHDDHEDHNKPNARLVIVDAYFVKMTYLSFQLVNILSVPGHYAHMAVEVLSFKVTKLTL